MGNLDALIQTRSLLAMMSFLAKGVEVPPEHLEQKMVLDYEIPAAQNGEEKLIPFRLRSSRNRPVNSYAAVRYLDYWYYVDNSDIDSKISLTLMVSLFRILAPSGAGQAPVVTLPSG